MARFWTDNELMDDLWDGFGVGDGGLLCVYVCMFGYAYARVTMGK